MQYVIRWLTLATNTLVTTCSNTLASVFKSCSWAVQMMNTVNLFLTFSEAVDEWMDKTYSVYVVNHINEPGACLHSAEMYLA